LWRPSSADAGRPLAPLCREAREVLSAASAEQHPVLLVTHKARLLSLLVYARCIRAGVYCAQIQNHAESPYWSGSKCNDIQGYPLFILRRGEKSLTANFPLTFFRLM
jgi:hypothetical protein